MIQHASPVDGEQAAMFVDYENLYSVLTAQSSKHTKTGAYATEILEEVCRYLEEGDDTPTIFGRAYGPFDVLFDTEDAGVPSNLHRLGIDPVYVPSAMQGNTSELQLTIEVTDFLRTRPDVETLVLVTGDRPYLPLVRTIREQGCRPLVAAVNPPQTDAYAESDLYLDARNLLSQDSREELLANAPEQAPSHNSSNPPPSSQRYERLDGDGAQRAIRITQEHFGQYDEVYLTPLLRKLSDILGPDHDPKALVSELEVAGAARLEKRSGYPYDYTVLIVNEDHPDVQAAEDGQFHTSETEETSSASNGVVSTDGETPDDLEEEPDTFEYDEYAIDEALSSDGEESDTDAPPADGAETSSDPDDVSEDEDVREPSAGESS